MSDKLISFGKEMYGRGLDKCDEFEADRLGVVIAARAGYDSYGLPSVLQTLQAMNAQDSGLALMFKTHPAPGERLDALGEKMQPTLDAYSGQPQLAERFRAEFKPANSLPLRRQTARAHPGGAAGTVAERHRVPSRSEEAQVDEIRARRVAGSGRRTPAGRRTSGTPSIASAFQASPDHLLVGLAIAAARHPDGPVERKIGRVEARDEPSPGW